MARSSLTVTEVPLPALLVDTQSDRVAQANTAAVELTRRQDLVGAHLSALIAPGFAELAVFCEEIIHRGRAWTRSLGIRLPDHSRLDCEIRGQSLPDDPTHLLLLIIDLEEQARHARSAAFDEMTRSSILEWERAQAFFSELERRNQLILEAAGEGIYGINAEGKTTFLNRAAQDMLGYAKEDLIGLDMHTAIHAHRENGEHYPAHECPIYKAFRFEEVHRVEDEVFWRKDGKPISVEYVSTPIYDQGVLAGAVIIFRDISERKESERRLRSAMTEIASLRDRLQQENDYLREEILSQRAHHDIVGVSPAITHVVGRLELAAKLASNILITGEGGTGKSLVASTIHKESARRRRPLIRLRCGAVPPEQIGSELFGQLRGAFPGALRDKSGRLELAHGGILFLDGVDAIPLEQQGQLVAALETGLVSRLGDTRERKVDIRIIASSAKPLGPEVTAGRFREDLYFALAVQEIHCPALRERPEDIAPLAMHFLKLVSDRLGIPMPTITERIMADLTAYDWPGNVRELANVIERGAILSTDGRLVVEFASRDPAQKVQGGDILTEMDIESLVRANLVNCLRGTRGRVAGPEGAAARLGVRPTTLYSRMRRYGIGPQDWAS